MNFLIIKTSSLGDIIQAFPVLSYLRQKYPTAQIDWVVEREYQEVIEAHPEVRRSIVVDARRWRSCFSSAVKEIPTFMRHLRQEKYDVVFDLQANTKSACITLGAKAVEKVGFGWNSVSEILSFFVTSRHIEVDPGLQIQQRYLQVVQKFFGDEVPFLPREFFLKLSQEESKRLLSILKENNSHVMVACGSRWENKRISEEALVEILTRLKQDQNPAFYFISGNIEEQALANRLLTLFPEQSQVVTDLTLPLWQALIREMNLVLAVDSAALALCGTTQTPTWSFFGPTLASVYKPLGDHHTAWQGSCPYTLQFKARCPKLRTCRTGACLKQKLYLIK